MQRQDTGHSIHGSGQAQTSVSTWNPSQTRRQNREAGDKCVIHVFVLALIPLALTPGCGKGEWDIIAITETGEEWPGKLQLRGSRQAPGDNCGHHEQKLPPHSLPSGYQSSQYRGSPNWKQTGSAEAILSKLSQSLSLTRGWRCQRRPQYMKISKRHL